MKYSIHKGVIREIICGQSILISTLEARKVCPYLTQLNDSSAYIWKMLEDGKSTEEMLSIIINEYEIPAEEANESLTVFLNNMEAQNYISKENE